MASGKRARRQTIRAEGINVERKQCADCGQASLQDELRCWACGGSRFEAADVQLAGEPTICIGQAREITASWSTERTWPTAPLYVLCGAACALFTCVLGYWIGRASAPAVAVSPVAQQTAVAQPVALPSPPTALTVPAPGSYAPAGRTSSGPVATASSVYDPPVVTVQSKASRAPRPARAPVVSAAAQPPQAPIFANPMVQPKPSPQVITQQVIPPSGRAAFPVGASAVPPAAAPAPAPTASTAVVMLRNSAAVPVEVSIEGPEQWTAVVAPGSAIPVTLSPGSYQLRATGDGVRSRRSTLALASNRNYSLVVDRRREGDRDALILIEPALDGHSD